MAASLSWFCNLLGRWLRKKEYVHSAKRMGWLPLSAEGAWGEISPLNEERTCPRVAHHCKQHLLAALHSGCV